MRNLVGVLAIILIILLLAPGFTIAKDKIDVKKYGIKIPLNMGYYMPTDVNDYRPPEFAAQFAIQDEIGLGFEGGIGFSYRLDPSAEYEYFPFLFPFTFFGTPDNFGWEFGYNTMRPAIPSRYRASAFLPAGGGLESWAEQTVTGGEFYALPTWYWGWDESEFSLSLGPAIYFATLDRSVAIYNTVDGNANPAGSFPEPATGKALGFVSSFGFEMPVSESYFLGFNAGFRFAEIQELYYQTDSVDPLTGLKIEEKTIGVDLTGFYFGITLKSYFQPSSDWRSPRQ